MPVAMLNILAAKTMKPEYCSLISFLVKASPLWKCQRYSFGCIYFNLVSFMLCVVRECFRREGLDWLKGFWLLEEQVLLVVI